MLSRIWLLSSSLFTVSGVGGGVVCEDGGNPDEGEGNPAKKGFGDAACDLGVGSAENERSMDVGWPDGNWRVLAFQS